MGRETWKAGVRALAASRKRKHPLNPDDVSELTQSEILSLLGYTHHTSTQPGAHEGAHDILRNGEVVFTGKWFETWAWLAARGDITHDPAARRSA